MTHKVEQQWPEGWDQPMVENLLLFASSSPDEKLNWLEEMMGMLGDYLPAQDTVPLSWNS